MVFITKKIKKNTCLEFLSKKLLLNADLIHCASKNEEENLKKKLNKKFQNCNFTIRY